MKEKTIVFFARYYMYLVLALVVAYLLSYTGLVVPLVLTAAFSLTSVFVAKILKYLFAKKRGGGSSLFVAKNKYAFPSSHAAGLSSILLSTFGNYLWPFLLGSTIIILLARVKSGVHDYIDILAGVIPGLVVTATCIGTLALLLSI